MPKCPKCDKEVYFAERVTSLGKDWHRPCLKCEKCGKTLTSGGHSEVGGAGGSQAGCRADSPLMASLCSMKASPTATTPATLPRSGPKVRPPTPGPPHQAALTLNSPLLSLQALGGVALRVTRSSEPDGGDLISGCPTANSSSMLLPGLTPRQPGLPCGPSCPQ
ncbi:hypothetical protein MC885_014227 [Smutsia gigantea]|nr:hypothetical protein MC885_014227 [Smutsia gigantea]